MKNITKLLIGAAAVGAVTAEFLNVYKEMMGREDRPQMPVQKLVTKMTYTSDDAAEEKKKELADECRKLPSTKYTMKSDRGETLAGFYWEPKEKKHPNTIVISCHGYHATHESDPYTVMPHYLELGYSFFAPDLTSSGESEGKYVGFDYYESQDLLKWIKFLQEEFGEDKQFILHGTSMGAATVMRICGDLCPECVKAIVEDCGYTSAEDEFEYILENNGFKKAKPIYKAFNSVSKHIAGYDLNDTDVTEQVKNAAVPILFIHGDADTFVPTKMVYELYNMCPEDKRTLKVIKGAGHASSVVVDEKEYYDALDNFLSSNLSE